MDVAYHFSIVYNWFQHYSKDSLKREFEENNLQIIETYSDVAGKEYDSESPELAIVAQKKNGLHVLLMKTGVDHKC
ncbi:hypothetical protein [Pelotomaculum propionicicum]|uniref:Uncharacterized protein n=1 Tax=Pelotomaculum propionicicum TaxID=258475 RepID=A0A4Y7RSR0_9FIRM|nr:hypothetical protein [Pelotomaculum propionicicum]NLI14167.1 hypothetical protein [Peptococcaceae bacterium]TEB12025.1 hypothetical protein Pmgp_01181 [Pelotomaculum propionicicum]